MIRKLYRIDRFPHGAPQQFTTAHLEIYGIDHFRPSFGAMVFFNDAEVTAELASEERGSYAGGFAVFGHGTCYGDEGHCTNPAHRRRFDVRRSHPLTKAFKRIDVTAALRGAVAAGNTLEIAIVAETHGDALSEEHMPLFKCAGLQLVTFL